MTDLPVPPAVTTASAKPPCGKPPCGKPPCGKTPFGKAPASGPSSNGADPDATAEFGGFADLLALLGGLLPMAPTSTPETPTPTPTPPPAAAPNGSPMAVTGRAVSPAVLEPASATGVVTAEPMAATAEAPAPSPGYRLEAVPAATIATPTVPTPAPSSPPAPMANGAPAARSVAVADPTSPVADPTSPVADPTSPVSDQAPAGAERPVPVGHGPRPATTQASASAPSTPEPSPSSSTTAAPAAAPSQGGGPSGDDDADERRDPKPGDPVGGIAGDTSAALAAPGVAPAPLARTGGATAPEPSPSRPASPADVADQIASAVVPLHRRGDGSHQVTLDLHPDDLGAIRVEVSVEHQTVHLTLHAAEPATAALLDRALPDLRSALADAGLHAGQVGVGPGGGDVAGRRRNPDAAPSGAADRDRRNDSAPAPAIAGVGHRSAVAYAAGRLDVLL